MGFTDQLDTNKQQMDETFTEAIQRQILSKDSNMSTWVLLVISKKKKCHKGLTSYNSTRLRVFSHTESFERLI